MFGFGPRVGLDKRMGADGSECTLGDALLWGACAHPDVGHRKVERGGMHGDGRQL